MLVQARVVRVRFTIVISTSPFSRFYHAAFSGGGGIKCYTLSVGMSVRPFRASDFPDIGKPYKLGSSLVETALHNGNYASKSEIKERKKDWERKY